MTTFAPDVSRVRSTFFEAVARNGGSMREVLQSTDAIIMRALLPGSAEVRPGDVHQRGIALSCSGPSIELHPYTFREVCSNGAIMAQSVDSVRLERGEDWDGSRSADVLIDLHQAVTACAVGDGFETSIHDMQAATVTPRSVDTLLNLLPLMSALPNSNELLRTIIDHFLDEGDETAYGVMNAVTATARDTRDRRVKWDLEALGGGIPAKLEWTPSPDQSSAECRPTRQPM